MAFKSHGSVSETPAFVRLIEVMGNDARVVNAARVSFDRKADQYTNQQNEGLIRYLASHNHWTPFAHCAATIWIRCPIFIARQFMRSNVGLVYNEVSRRYVHDDPGMPWLPKEWRGKAKPGESKQGSDPDVKIPVEPEVVEAMQLIVNLYLETIKKGVAPEQARTMLPLGVYTEFYCTGSLAAFARVCNLRSASDAQAEIQEYADLISQLLANKFPISWKYLTKNGSDDQPK